MKKNLSVSREMRIQVNQHKRENLIVETVVDTVGVWGGRGGKIEEITYIVPFLALGVVESVALAVAASRRVVPIVPRCGSVGARGQQGAGCLLSIRLVLGVQSGGADTHCHRGYSRTPEFLFGSRAFVFTL